ALGRPGVLRAVLEEKDARQRPARPLLAMRRALGRSGDETPLLQHALGPRVAARERRPVRHGPALDRFMEVLGREIEVAGAEFLNHPRNLVHARPPGRRTAPPGGPG